MIKSFPRGMKSANVIFEFLANNIFGKYLTLKNYLF